MNMLYRICFAVLFFINVIVIGQNKSRLDSLKEKDNYSEFIYTYLESFSKNKSIENLFIFELIQNQLWRNPISRNEQEATLFYHINYAFYLKQFDDIYKSNLEYEKAYFNFKKYNLIDFDIIEYCLKPMANNYTRLGELNRAEDVLKISINKAIETNNKDHLIASYSNLAALLRTKGMFHNAISNLNSALNICDNRKVKSRLHSDLAINYFLLKNIEEAKAQISLSNQLNIRSDKSIELTNNKTLGGIYLLNNEPENALLEYKKALIKANEIYGNGNREVAKIVIQLAEIYKNLQLSEESLSYYQNALSILLPKYSPKNIYENPTPTYFYPENTLKEALDGRADSFRARNELEAALKNYDLSFIVENELNATFLNQDSKLLQQLENRNRSEKCIEICYLLFEETGDENWIERAFQYAEKTKAKVLNEAKELKSVKRTFNSDILFVKEEQLFLRKAQLNRTIVVEQLKSEQADVNLIKYSIQQRDEVDSKLQILNEQIYSKYPNLKSAQDSLISVKKLREFSIKKSTSIIEFFDGQNAVFIFSLNKGNAITLLRIIKTEKFKNELLEFINLFSESRGIALQNDVSGYTNLGFLLYKKLFPKSIPESISLIPDGLFSFLPFDALLTKKTGIKNFEKLPYLIQSSKISYAYSANMLLNNSLSNKRLKDASVLGFFPIFKENYRQLSELNFTEKEAESIENYFDGKFLIGREAIKNNFMELKSNYDIIHFSTHASSGTNFEPPILEFYDESLYLPEIYGYNINTELLVLSACETGIGTIKKGEGVLSLARGFSYAGVKNLIVSLWQVNDKSTEELMTNFYANLSKNENTSDAIHKSKLDYLKNNTVNSRKKSPYYWASFIYIGQVETGTSFNYKWLLLFVIGLVLLGVFIVLKKRKFAQTKK